MLASKLTSAFVTNTVWGTGFIVGTVIGQDVVTVITSYLRNPEKEKQKQ